MAILLGMAALAALALLVDGGSLVRAARYAAEHPLGLAAAFAAYTGAFVLRAGAWRVFVPKGVSPVRLFDLILAALFLNHAAPAKAGDFARMYGVSKLGVPGSRAAAGVILARLADLGGLLAVLAGAWLLAGGARWGAVAAPTAAVALVAVVLWAFARSGRTFGEGKLAQLAEKLRGVLRATRPRTLAAAFLWAAPAWVLEAGILLLVVRGLGLDVSLAGVVAATCFAVLVATVPLAPGSIGTYEAGMVFALAALGVPAAPAFTAAVASHALKFLYAFACAPLAFYEGVSVVRVREGMDADEARIRV